MHLRKTSMLAETTTVGHLVDWVGLKTKRGFRGGGSDECGAQEEV